MVEASDRTALARMRRRAIPCRSVQPPAQGLRMAVCRSSETIAFEACESGFANSDSERSFRRAGFGKFDWTTSSIGAMFRTDGRVGWTSQTRWKDRGARES